MGKGLSHFGGTLTASNAGGTSSATVTINVVQAPVISRFDAIPAVIYQGDGSTLTWTVSTATSTSIDQGIGNVASTSSRWVSPSWTTTYTLTATNSLNGVSVTRSASATVMVNPRPTVPRIDNFSADSTTIGAGTGTTLRWSVSNSVGDVSVSLSGIGPVPANGSIWVTPGATTTYTLTATNNLDTTKSVNANLVVTVVQKSVVEFQASPSSINIGNSSTLTWTCTNDPTSVTIDHGIGSVIPSGSMVVTPTETTTYTITASNLAGTTQKQVTVSVTQKPVIVSFTADPSGITKGRSSTLNWNIQGADSITLNGQVISGNSLVVAPATTQTYILIATNIAGSTPPAQVTVTVAESGTLTWKRDILYLGTRQAAEIDASGMHVTMVDHLGSPRIVTGPTGLVESRQKYLPFGELLDRSGNYVTSKGYTNHEQTDPSGLIYMQARFYLPMYGRFTSPDPARDQHFEDTQSWNIYSYVRNNPIMSTDPTGMLELAAYAQQSADADQTGEMWGFNEERAAVSEKEKVTAQTKVEYAKEVPKEVKAAIEIITGYLNDGTTWKPVGGMRTPAQNKATKGSKGSDHVALKEEEGKKGAEDGHWIKDGKNVDKAVYDKIKTDSLYLGDGIQAIFHPGNSAHLEHFHLGFSDKRVDTVYTKETGPNIYTPEKRVITILGEEND